MPKIIRLSVKSGGWILWFGVHWCRTVKPMSKTDNSHTPSTDFMFLYNSTYKEHIYNKNSNPFDARNVFLSEDLSKVKETFTNKYYVQTFVQHSWIRTKKTKFFVFQTKTHRK